MDEVEFKFRVDGPEGHARVRERLVALGAQEESPTVHEENRVYDNANGMLAAAGAVLRLRGWISDRGGAPTYDKEAELTYKGRARYDNGAKSRKELNIGVDDFEETDELLHLLGFHRTVTYEKYREDWELPHAIVSLDTLAFGHFVEIEAIGVGEAAIRPLISQLGLDESQVELAGYPTLMARYLEEKESAGGL